MGQGLRCSLRDCQSMGQRTSQDPQRLHELPDSVLINVLRFVGVSEHAALACTCKYFFHLVHGSQQTGACVAARCFLNEGVCSEPTPEAPNLYFQDILRVVSSPLARLVSNQLCIMQLYKTYRFRAVFHPCGPSHSPAAQLYSEQDLDPATGLPWPIEGQEWANSMSLCWSDILHSGQPADSAQTRKRYR